LPPWWYNSGLLRNLLHSRYQLSDCYMLYAFACSLRNRAESLCDLVQCEIAITIRVDEMTCSDPFAVIDVPSGGSTVQRNQGSKGLRVLKTISGSVAWCKFVLRMLLFSLHIRLAGRLTFRCPDAAGLDESSSIRDSTTPS